MKKIVVLIYVAILIGAGIAYAGGHEVKKKAGDYTVEAEIDKNPPVVGDNNIKVKIKDSSGKHVTDAKVVIEYSMPAMPGMPAVNYKTDTGLEGNEYGAKMSLSMAGSWNIAVKITRAGKTSSMKFTIDAK